MTPEPPLPIAQEIAYPYSYQTLLLLQDIAFFLERKNSLNVDVFVSPTTERHCENLARMTHREILTGGYALIWPVPERIKPMDLLFFRMLSSGGLSLPDHFKPDSIMVVLSHTEGVISIYQTVGLRRPLTWSHEEVVLIDPETELCDICQEEKSEKMRCARCKTSICSDCFAQMALRIREGAEKCAFCRYGLREHIEATLIIADSNYRKIQLLTFLALTVSGGFRGEVNGKRRENDATAFCLYWV